MAWEHGRELATISDGTTTWTNTYNADGLRTKRTNGTTTYEYIYLGDKLIQIHVGDDVLKFGYDASGAPMYLQFNNSRYFYATNVQGDVTALVHTSGTAVVEYTYDAWGNILTTTGSMAGTLGQINPLRYRGYVYDPETELYYCQSRYYDPKIGRFINADEYISTGQSLLGNNMFTYCVNNPVGHSDPSGSFPIEIIVTSAGFVVGVVICGIAVAHYGAMAITAFVDWLSTQWYYASARISFVSSERKEETEPEPPDVTYPGDDPTKAPDGYEWKGKGEQGSKEGSYYNSDTGESLHPDLDHPEGKAPHWDYNYRGSGHKGWRIFADGTIELKK